MKILKKEELFLYISEEKLKDYHDELYSDPDLNERISYYSLLKSNLESIPLDKASLYGNIPSR